MHSNFDADRPLDVTLTVGILAVAERYMYTYNVLAHVALCTSRELLRQGTKQVLDAQETEQPHQHL